MTEPRFAVIGNPIAHSRSPELHTAFALQTGIALRYEKVLAPLDGFAATVARFAAERGRGANVTLPFKAAACQLSTRLAPRARRANVVNTLSFRGGEIEGDLTDGVGLLRDLERRLGRGLTGARVLLLGAGGAALGTAPAVVDARPNLLVIANRTIEKAHALANAVGAAAPGTAVRALTLNQIAGARFDVVINATSASLGGTPLALPEGVFAPGALAYDMVYGQGETAFMAAARAEHAHAVDGLGMLIEQAAESFLIWHGVRPDTAPILASWAARVA